MRTVDWLTVFREIGLQTSHYQYKFIMKDGTTEYVPLLGGNVDEYNAPLDCDDAVTVIDVIGGCYLKNGKGSVNDPVPWELLYTTAAVCKSAKQLDRESSDFRGSTPLRRTLAYEPGRNRSWFRKLVDLCRYGTTEFKEGWCNGCHAHTQLARFSGGWYCRKHRNVCTPTAQDICDNCTSLMSGECCPSCHFPRRPQMQVVRM